MARKNRDPEQKKRRSLLDSLFEPAEASETDGLFNEPDPDDPELIHLFDDDEVEYSDEQDEAALSGLIWNDGERVVDDVSALAERELPRRRAKRGREKAEPARRYAHTPDEPAVYRKKNRRGAGGPHRLAWMQSVREEEPPARAVTDEDAPSRQSAAADRAADTMSAAAFWARANEPARGESPAPTAAPAPTEQAEPRTDTPPDPPAPQSREGLHSPSDGSADGTDGAADETPIRLFDEEERPLSRYGADGSGRTRMFRTGSSTAARIHFNETETVRSIDEAKRRRRAEDAKRQHEQYVQRQKRKLRRKRTAKRMAANIAFVAAIVAAVLVALYYTFLLKDIVVSGNESYSDEYIVGLSGLQYGRHMLLCDLDAAREGIANDPYLQVDSVSYIFPARVRIAVTERKEVAGIIGLDYNVIIDHNGFVLSMGGGTDLKDLLQVTGVGMTGFQVGERLGQSDDFGTATLIQMIHKLETFLLIDDIATLDLTTPLAISMTARNGLKIQVGQPTDLDEKMLSLHENLPQFISGNISTGTLFLSARGGTVYSPTHAGQALVSDPLDPNAILPLDPNAVPDPNDPVAGTEDPNAVTTPNPGIFATPAPPTPTPLQPGGGDDFQG